MNFMGLAPIVTIFFTFLTSVNLYGSCELIIDGRFLLRGMESERILTDNVSIKYDCESVTLGGMFTLPIKEDVNLKVGETKIFQSNNRLYSFSFYRRFKGGVKLHFSSWDENKPAEPTPWTAIIYGKSENDLILNIQPNVYTPKWENIFYLVKDETSHSLMPNWISK